MLPIMVKRVLSGMSNSGSSDEEIILDYPSVLM